MLMDHSLLKGCGIEVESTVKICALLCAGLGTYSPDYRCQLDLLMMAAPNLNDSCNDGNAINGGI